MRRANVLRAMLGSACTLLLGTYVTAQVPKEEMRKAPAPAQPQAKRPTVRTEIMKQAIAPAAREFGGVIAAPVAAPTRDAQIQQLAQQLRPLLRVEYHFVRTVCDLSKEQRRQIARAGERALREAASRNVGANLNGARIFVAGQAMPEEVARVNDPQKHIQGALAKAVKEHVSPEEAARYAQELKRREEHAKQVAVCNVVARLDQELLLTSDQRKAITESLLSHWDDSWGVSIPAMINIDHYFPPIPDSRIVPSLNPVQKDAWQSTQGSRRIIRFGISLGTDDGIEDEELTEARQADANPKVAP